MTHHPSDVRKVSQLAGRSRPPDRFSRAGTGRQGVSAWSPGLKALLSISCLLMLSVVSAPSRAQMDVRAESRSFQRQPAVAAANSFAFVGKATASMQPEVFFGTVRGDHLVPGAFEVRGSVKVNRQPWCGGGP
jgi:hypothetical protein